MRKRNTMVWTKRSLPRTKFQFEMNKSGDIARVSAALEPALGEDIVFTKVTEKPKAP